MMINASKNKTVLEIFINFHFRSQSTFQLFTYLSSVKRFGRWIYSFNKRGKEKKVTRKSSKQNQSQNIQELLLTLQKQMNFLKEQYESKSSCLKTLLKDNKSLRGKNVKKIENSFLNSEKLYFLITMETK